MKDFSQLTKRGKIQRYRRALTLALQRYALTTPSIRFVSLDSKPVFRVESKTGSFAAKFHDPTEHRLSQMFGEMQFLTHVSKRTDLCVETPLANTDGDLITEVRIDCLPAPAHVALCSWLAGRQLRNAISPSSYRNLGTCSALLHRASASFRPGRSFDILTNDRVFYWDSETLLTRDDPHLLPVARQTMFREGAKVAQQAIGSLWRRGDPIVIHNDLHPCNVKIHRGTLSLYDFEDITWGFPEQDIGTAMYHVRFRKDFATLLNSYREGYEKIGHWPLDTERHLDRFIMSRLLMFANYVVNFGKRPRKHLPRFQKELGTLMKAQA